MRPPLPANMQLSSVHRRNRGGRMGQARAALVRHTEGGFRRYHSETVETAQRWAWEVTHDLADSGEDLVSKPMTPRATNAGSSPL